MAGVEYARKIKDHAHSVAWSCMPYFHYRLYQTLRETYPFQIGLLMLPLRGIEWKIMRFEGIFILYGKDMGRLVESEIYYGS